MRIWGRGVCSDVARRVAIRCRVVIKTGVSMRAMVCAYGGGGARMRIWGKGVCSDVARRVVLKPQAHGGMRGGHGMRMATPMGGLWARYGSQ